MKRKIGFIALLAVALSHSPALAETCRALLVGIDKYVPAAAERTVVVAKVNSGSPPAQGRGSWIDLDGCVNDVDAIREILLAKYGFKAEDILVLSNAEATRDRILQEIPRHLADPAAPGDVSFFFYAGHGSQVKNLASREADGQDESIVPADSALGALDIRDKELNRAFSKVLDRSALLTVVLDSCHSGSAMRGIGVGKTRSVAPDPRPVTDPGDDVRPLGDRGALVLSAAQDYQSAAEKRDEDNTPHGAFTVALLTVLRRVPVNESAERFFMQVKAALQSEGSAQEPVIEGKSRLGKPFLGVGSAALAGRTSVAVMKVEGDKMVILQAGSAIGLSPGCELVLSGKQESPLRVRVNKITGLARSEGELLAGTAKDLPAGTILEVDTWAARDDDLRLWVPPDALPLKALSELGPEIETIRASNKAKWIQDPAEELPSVIVSYEGGTWLIHDLPGRRTMPLGERLLGSKVLAALEELQPPGQRKLFLRLPPPAELVSELSTQARLDQADSAIRRAGAEGSAHYLLVGRMAKEGPEYAFVLPNLETTDATKLPLPIRSDWVAAGSDNASPKRAAGVLNDKALTLRRAKGWLTLEQGEGGGRGFPYSLALRSLDDKTREAISLSSGVVRELVSESDRKSLQVDLGPLKDGEKYNLALVRDEVFSLPVTPRWVYVFVIDRNGKSQKLFPQSGVENRFPMQREGAPALPEIIDLADSSFRVSPPYGLDTYVLLTSVEPIDPAVLEWEGARTRGRGPRAGLETLLFNVSQGTRGANPDPPKNWSVERLQVLSVGK